MKDTKMLSQKILIVIVVVVAVAVIIIIIVTVIIVVIINIFILSRKHYYYCPPETAISDTCSDFASYTLRYTLCKDDANMSEIILILIMHVS